MVWYTVDAIFALHGMILHHINKGEKLYLCFIVHKKAFASIDRNKFYFINLLDAESRGGHLSVIRKLVIRKSNVKSCLKFK